MFAGISHKPEIIVLDLDYTLWPFDADKWNRPNFTNENGVVYDQYRQIINLYPETQAVIKGLRNEKGVTLACASMCPETQVAEALLVAFGWGDCFPYREIYSSLKTKHFKAIHQKSNVAYNKMLFFDDRPFNITQISGLGVHCRLVPRQGITVELVRQALLAYDAYWRQKLSPMDLELTSLPPQQRQQQQQQQQQEACVEMNEPTGAVAKTTVPKAGNEKTNKSTAPAGKKGKKGRN